MSHRDPEARKAYARAYYLAHPERFGVTGRGRNRSGSESDTWKGDNAGYFALHLRVRNARGRAAEYLCEGCCGGQAAQWATIHGKSGTDPWADYVPLCQSCHWEYDRRIAA